MAHSQGASSSSFPHLQEKTANPGVKTTDSNNSTLFKDIVNVHRLPLCALCRKNGEPREVYTSHCVKSPDGIVTCPILRKHICEICGSTGDKAHTRSHCPNFTGFENKEYKPKYRILSNGKSTRIIHHK